MRDKLLGLLGLMRRANAIAVGEVNTGSSARAREAKLLLLAADASENAGKRAAGFAAAAGVPLVPLPFTKEEFAGAVGLSGGSMAAVTDGGFAAALLKGLASLDPERYASAQQEWDRHFSQTRKAGNTRIKRIGKRRTNG